MLFRSHFYESQSFYIGQSMLFPLNSGQVFLKNFQLFCQTFHKFILTSRLKYMLVRLYNEFFPIPFSFVLDTMEFDPKVCTSAFFCSPSHLFFLPIYPKLPAFLPRVLVGLGRWSLVRLKLYLSIKFSATVQTDSERS